MNLLLTFGVLAAFAAVVAAAVAAYRARRAAEVLSAEVGLGTTAAPAPSGAIPTRVLSGRDIFEQNRAALFVLGYLKGNRVGGLCSAFAIAPDLLATNAHCVLAARARGGSPIATQNDSGGKTRFNVTGMALHPGYREGTSRADSPDVGLIRIDGRAPRLAELANDAELRSIGPGDDAFVIGFPGRVMDPLSPSATFLQGRVGRVTGMGEQAAAPDKAVLIQHDAVTRGGNSGSPIFNQYGHVIGVHAAHIDEEDEVSIGGQKTTVVRASPFRLGMRIDLLREVPRP
jgi:S1-C subfamily serine protease